jgi:hypothetical protein
MAAESVCEEDKITRRRTDTGASIDLASLASRACRTGMTGVRNESRCGVRYCSTLHCPSPTVKAKSATEGRS